MLGTAPTEKMGQLDSLGHGEAWLCGLEEERRPVGVGLGWASKGTAPSRRWAHLIAWTSEHGHRVVCSGVLGGGLLDVFELEAVVEVVQSWAADQCWTLGGGGWLALLPWSRWATVDQWLAYAPQGVGWYLIHFEHYAHDFWRQFFGNIRDAGKPHGVVEGDSIP